MTVIEQEASAAAPRPAGGVGQTVGYVRVSSIDQNAARQLAGVHVDQTFTDHASGKDTRRPALEEMLRYVRRGDVLAVHSMDRLARNLVDLRQLVAQLVERGVEVWFVQDGLHFVTKERPGSTLLLSVMGAVAEFERSMIRERQAEGIALAKQRGVYRGRRPSLTTDQADELRSRAAAGETKASLAKAFGVSVRTVYGQLASTQNHQSPTAA